MGNKSKLLEVPKAVKFLLLGKVGQKSLIEILLHFFQKWMGYQMVNESLSWLRDNELRYGKNSPDANTNVLEMDNQQPSS